MDCLVNLPELIEVSSRKLIEEGKKMNLAQLTAQSILNEVGTDKACSLSAADFESLVLAYAESEVKKFTKFSDLYRTNDEFRSNFQQLIIRSV